MNNRSTPSLKQLRAFSAVYRLRKISAAAEQLHVTQSAISVLLKDMEELMGCRLFDRTTRSLQPTQAAADVIDLAERILYDVDSLGQGLRDATGLRRGRVCVAITPTLAQFLLPAAAAEFRASHPQVQLVIDDCAPDQFVSRVLGGHVDVGIGSPEGAAADVDTRTLARDHLAFVCQAGHRLAAKRAVRWADLADEPVITVRPGYGVRNMVDRAAATAGVQLDVVNEVGFLSTALWMTASGLGSSIMPAAYAINGGQAGVVVRKLTHPTVSRDVHVVTQKGRRMQPACARFVGMLEESIQRRGGVLAADGRPGH